MHIIREPVFLSSFDLNRARDLKMSHLYLAHLSHLYIAVICSNQIIYVMELRCRETLEFSSRSNRHIRADALEGLQPKVHGLVSRQFCRPSIKRDKSHPAAESASPIWSSSWCRCSGQATSSSWIIWPQVAPVRQLIPWHAIDIEKHIELSF